nr:CRIB domain-containing protein RIC6-like [Ipomoea trifida]
MSTNMKGLLKGLRYISQIFEEEKEEEIQIGLPTDVKHVAHIGWDGGQSVDNPSWMKDFKGSAAVQSDDTKDNLEVLCGSEDSNRRGTRSDDKDPDLPKSSKRQSDNPDSPKSKNKNSRRNRSKETSAADSAAAAGDVPDIPKKSRRKKSKDNVSGDGSTRSAKSSKRKDSGQDSEASMKSAYSDFGDGSTRSNKCEGGGASESSAADAPGAW